MSYQNPISAMIAAAFRTKGTAEHTQKGPTRAAEARAVLNALLNVGPNLRAGSVKQVLTASEIPALEPSLMCVGTRIYVDQPAEDEPAVYIVVANPAGLLLVHADGNFEGAETPASVVPLAGAGLTEAEAVAAVLAASGRGLNELVLPQAVVGGKWYAYPSGIWEARSSFSASAAPVAGPNWRLVVAFSSYTNQNAVDAVTASGQFAGINDIRLLTAPAGAYLIPATGTPSRYATAQQAHDAATSGDTLVLSGSHDTLIVTKNLTVFGGHIRTDLAIGNYQDRSGPPVRARLRGLQLSGRMVVIHHASTTAAHDVRLENPLLGENAFFEQFGLGVPGSPVTPPDLVMVTNARIRNLDAYVAPGPSANGRGLLRFQERNDDYQRSRWTFEDCGELLSLNNALLTGYVHPDTRVVWAGSTRLNPGARGVAELFRTVGGQTVTAADIVVDERPTGGPGADLSNYYTKTQADARYAPIGSAGGGEPGAAPAGIDFANPVTLNAAATLEGNKAYYATGAGYALTLPDAAANLGKAIFVEIASTATGLYPVGALRMYAGETMNFRATPGGWKQTGGELLPMSARLETTLSQQDAVAAGPLYTVPVTTVRAAVPESIASSATATVLVQRSGRATVNLFAAMSQTTLGGVYVLILERRTAAGVISYPLQDGFATTSVGDIYKSMSYTGSFLAGDQLRMQIYASVSGRLTGNNPGSECSITFTEIV